MKTLFLFIFLISAIGQTALAQSDQPIASQECHQLLSQHLDFLVDGSFQDEQVLGREMTRLKACGIDDFDVKFFGRMDSMSSMLRKMTKEKSIEQLTYGDLLLSIEQLKATDAYSELKSISMLSEALATKVGSLKSWSSDLEIFNELGASKAVIARVYEYLENHPANTKTYQEILEVTKQG